MLYVAATHIQSLSEINIWILKCVEKDDLIDDEHLFSFVCLEVIVKHERVVHSYMEHLLQWKYDLRLMLML